jgi:hypothetical protein
MMIPTKPLTFGLNTFEPMPNFSYDPYELLCNIYNIRINVCVLPSPKCVNLFCVSLKQIWNLVLVIFANHLHCLGIIEIPFPSITINLEVIMGVDKGPFHIVVIYHPCEEHYKQLI